MEKSPLISVIIPVYNVQDYIAECLESIIDQSYTNLEIIVVNDGSTDNTMELCTKFAEKDSRIKIWNKSNGGASTARNFGLDNATGDYITFVDSDDFLDQKMLEVLYSNSDSCDITFCNMNYYYPNNSKKTEFTSTINTKIFSKESLLKQICTFKRPIVIVPCAKLFKKEIWQGLRFIENRVHEDEFIVHHFIDKANKIKYIDLPLYYYRQDREGSVMGSITEKKVIDYFDACLDREAFFLQKGMRNDAKKIYNSGKSYLVRNLLKLKIKTEETSIKSVLKDKKLYLSTKLELVFKILLRS